MYKIYFVNVLMTLQRYNTYYYSRKYFYNYFYKKVKIFFRALIISILQKSLPHN